MFLNFGTNILKWSNGQMVFDFYFEKNKNNEGTMNRVIRYAVEKNWRFAWKG
jgi:hypothetical protein